MTARRAVQALSVVLAAGLTFASALSYARVNRHFPGVFIESFRGIFYCYGFLAAGYAIAFSFWNRVERHYPERRQFLRIAKTASLTIPALVTGYGTFIERTQIRPREMRIAIPNLPKDLQGLRIAQITDIHLSLFLSEKEFAPAIGMANDFRPHLTLVTGDLISHRGDPVDACLRQLSRLKADAGMLGCLGNHEVYAQAEDYVAEQGARIGLPFLRMERKQLRFGEAVLNVGGVDYQNMHTRYLVGAERLIQKAPNTLNMLLSHNPDVFPVAEAQGWDVTIAGHTHGGQVTFELLHQYANIARFFTPYVDGLYRRNNSSIYVSRGIGTIGLPVRLAAPPEVGILTLCAT